MYVENCELTQIESCLFGSKTLLHSSSVHYKDELKRL